jgi:hypothetical protein
MAAVYATVIITGAVAAMASEAGTINGGAAMVPVATPAQCPRGEMAHIGHFRYRTTQTTKMPQSFARLSNPAFQANERHGGVSSKKRWSGRSRVAKADGSCNLIPEY